MQGVAMIPDLSDDCSKCAIVITYLFRKGSKRICALCSVSIMMRPFL